MAQVEKIAFQAEKEKGTFDSIQIRTILLAYFPKFSSINPYIFVIAAASFSRECPLPIGPRSFNLFTGHTKSTPTSRTAPPTFFFSMIRSTMVCATFSAVTQVSISSITHVNLSAVQRGVLTQPGATALTRILSFGSKSVRERVKPGIACLLAAYRGAGRKADCAAIDETITTPWPSF
jgi:hypothetical protein